MNNTLNCMTRGLLLAGIAIAPFWVQAEEKKERRVLRIEKHDGGDHEIRFLRPTQVKEGRIVTHIGGSEGGSKTWLGVHIGDVSKVTATQLGLKPGTGLVVEHIVEDSPADKAGLEQYDILIEFNDQLLVNAEQLQVLVGASDPDETVDLTLIRGGKRRTVEAKLDEHEVEAIHLRASKVLGAVAGDDDDTERKIVRFWNDDGGVVSDVVEEMIWKGKVRDDVGPFHTRTIELGNAITVLKDDTGTYHLRNKDGKRHLRFENEDGKVVFEGLFNGDDTKGLPKEVIRKLKSIHSPEELGVRQIHRIFKGKEGDDSHDGEHKIEVEIETDDHPVEIRVPERSL